MQKKVVQRHRDREPIAQYIRVGRGHTQLEALLGSGRLYLDRAVFTAGAVDRQRDLLRAIQKAHAEVVLDPTVAELSAIGRFAGASSRAPGAISGRPLSLSDIETPQFAEQIARFAIANGFSAVLSPTHFITDATDRPLTADLKSCIAMRAALDREGGSHVGLDYELSIPNPVLKDAAQRLVVLKYLKDLPFENLWLHISRFGANATAVGVRRYIEALLDVVTLGYPMVIDGVAGLSALAVIAFGAAGGVAHGVGDLERFDASDCNAPPKENGSFGLPSRVLVSALDRQLDRKQFDAIVAAPGGRKAISCGDIACCSRGLADMWQDPKSHYLYQRRKAIEKLGAVPNPRRAQHFIEIDLGETERKARAIARLRITDAEVVKMVVAQSSRLERFRPILEHLHETTVANRRSRSPRFRASRLAPGRRAEL